MKFLHYFALVASTTAIRLQQTETGGCNLEVPDFESLTLLDKRIPDPEKVWKHFDIDNNGTWNLCEAQAAIKKMMKYFGHKLPKGWKKDFAEAFKRIDTSGDGEIAPMEMGAYMFQMIDTNGDGFWSPDEVKAGIENIAKFTKNKLREGWWEDVMKVMEMVDTNNDHQVSMKELFAALKLHGIPDINDLFEKPSGKGKGKSKGKKLNVMTDALVFLEKHIPNPEEIWKRFDADENGKWSLDEAMKAFKKGMKYFGHKLPEGWRKHFKAEFNKADTSGDGEVDPMEMGAYMFQMIDENDDGFWQPKEVKNAIKAIASFTGNKLREGWWQDVKKVMSMVDTNNDGKVSPKELFAALKLHGIPDINDLFEKEGKELKLSHLVSLEKHVPSPKEVWEHFDKNGDNELDFNETKTAFKETMEYFGHELPQGWRKMLKAEFKAMDTDKSGKVNKTEALIYLFKMVDSNDDGKWQKAEVYGAIEWLAKFTRNTLIKDWKKKVDEAFEHVDTNNDCWVSAKEIFQALEENGFPNINDLFEKQ